MTIKRSAWLEYHLENSPIELGITLSVSLEINSIEK
jgi:hypothetical protein